jgi:hypothetical protein
MTKIDTGAIKMENNNEWIIALYHYLDSILPPGGADEAFRVAPEAIREEIAALETEPGYVTGISARHTPKAGCLEVTPSPEIALMSNDERK